MIKEFWDVIRERPGDLKMLFFQLVDSLGPLDSNGDCYGESSRAYAEWLLDPDNILRVGRAARGVPLVGSEVGREPQFAPRQKTYFAGSGAYSLRDGRILHERLDFALSAVSHNQQEGGMGTTYDEKNVAAREQEIRLVIEDIAYALLGDKAKTFMDFNAPPLGDPTYHRKVPSCLEAEGPAAVNRFLADQESNDE